MKRSIELSEETILLIKDIFDEGSMYFETDFDEGWTLEDEEAWEKNWKKAKSDFMESIK